MRNARYALPSSQRVTKRPQGSNLSELPLRCTIAPAAELKRMLRISLRTSAAPVDYLHVARSVRMIGCVASEDHYGWVGTYRADELCFLLEGIQLNKFLSNTYDFPVVMKAILPQSGANTPRKVAGAGNPCGQGCPTLCFFTVLKKTLLQSLRTGESWQWCRFDDQQTSPLKIICRQGGPVIV
jgi:hypothetical protein